MVYGLLNNERYKVFVEGYLRLVPVTVRSVSSVAKI